MSTEHGIVQGSVLPFYGLEVANGTAGVRLSVLNSQGQIVGVKFWMDRAATERLIELLEIAKEFTT